MAPDQETHSASSDLSRLLELIESPALTTVGSWPPDLASTRQSLARTIRSQLHRRIDAARSPVRVVFAGPTGSGKSTLLNSIVGRDVSRSGSIRPTTTLPLAYTHRRFASLFDADPIGYVIVTGGAPILQELCLIDTPDIDSTNSENHRLAESVLIRADVVVFVASALRYADLVPWRLLRDTRARGVPVIHVLNRISPHSAGVVTDFRRLLRREGMRGEVVRVEEHRLAPDGFLPEASIRNLRRLLMSSVVLEVEPRLSPRARLDAVSSRSLAFFEELEARLDGQADLRLELKRQLTETGAGEISARLGQLESLLRIGKPRRRRVTRGWLRRRRLSRAALDRVVGLMRAEVIALIEGRLRPFGFDKGSLVVDLRGEAPDLPRAVTAILDTAVDGWFNSLVITPDPDPDVHSYQRACEAMAAIQEVFGGDRDSVRSFAARTLEEAMSVIAIEIGGLTGEVQLEDLRADILAGRQIVERISRIPTLLNA